MNEYSNYDYGLEDEESEASGLRPPAVWTTRDGEEIPYRQRGNEHLCNILRMLRRYAQTNAGSLRLRWYAWPAATRRTSGTRSPTIGILSPKPPTTVCAQKRAVATSSFRRTHD